MKVVHLSTTDFGGAYKAAVRISESMQSCGVDSNILVRTKSLENSIGTEIFTNIPQKLISKTKNFINLFLSEGAVISDYLGTDVSKHPLVKEADVIVLHWVNSFISYRNVERLIKLEKPIIWVMHDMWLFTGGCHIDQYCGGYKHGCGNCPYLKHKRERDISRKNFLRKAKMMREGQILLVGPSQWIVDCARQSEITNKQTINRIPNPLDTAQYRPIENKSDLRNKYGIASDKKIILYGAMEATQNRNKGYHYLKEAISKLDTSKYELVVFGNYTEDKKINEMLKTHFLGYVRDERELIEIYNLSDVFVCPSQQDNYSNSVLEAQACNVPVVAFDIGGMRDIIVHKETGYLCQYENIDEMAKGIDYCVEINNKNIHQRIEEVNGYAVVGKRYNQLL